MKGIVTSVDHDDLLSVTLPRNMRHLTHCIVVTSPGDLKTQAVAAAVPGVRCFVTDAFTRNGASFNKGAALEAGFDALGRDGFILVWDADILLPDSVPWGAANPAKLYGAKRRLLNDPAGWETVDWKLLPLSAETGWPGYFQLFHGANPRIRERPWYGVDSPHAGGGDGYFQSRFPVEEKDFLPIEVLHLGPRDQNWFGRVSPRLDGAAVPDAHEKAQEMENLLARNGWNQQAQLK